MSREAQPRYKAMLEGSSSGESLPDEWTSAQKRLDHLQAAVLKLSKRTHKLEKLIQEQSQELQAGRRDVRAIVEQVLQEQSRQLNARERELEFENMRAQLDDLHAHLKRVEKKNNEMVKEIKSNVVGTALNDSRIEDKVEECAQRMMHKHQADTARAIAELRRIVTREQNYDQQEQQREPHTIERKSSEKALSNSRSKPNIQRSGQKSNRASHTQIPCQQPSIDHHLKSRSPQPHPVPAPAPANASSRVSYLREKLKEFEETNKRYEQKLEKRPGEGTPQSKTVQKMKDFRNYLEQSESELDQSNAEHNHNVLSESVKNWRNERYRYD